MELNPAPSTVAEIASGAGVTAAAVTTVLGLVADAGHLETSGRPGDARYRLTPAGPLSSGALPADVGVFLASLCDGASVTEALADYEEWKDSNDHFATFSTRLSLAAAELLAKYAGKAAVLARLDDLRTLLAAVDSDCLSTDNLPDLEERIGRLYAACEEP
jgi:hypothetical protein